jgi:hypothetical protein
MWRKFWSIGNGGVMEVSYSFSTYTNTYTLDGFNGYLPPSDVFLAITGGGGEGMSLIYRGSGADVIRFYRQQYILIYLLGHGGLRGWKK